ncbi:MAG TPA: hypothetical protein PLI13_10695, partial [Paracoccus sp. (in: a-proteobacteria)]|nr:hypothetical protein [Paracoccus sp. (in: a-proteobacteria)]
ANAAKDEILGAFTTETDAAKRLELFGQLQQSLYDDVGFIKIGNFAALQGQRKGMTGVAPSPWPAFWNASAAARARASAASFSARVVRARPTARQ